MFENKKIYNFHIKLIEKHSKELETTNITICDSLFICTLLFKKYPLLKCIKKQRTLPKYNYDYSCIHGDKYTRTSRNNKLLFRDFKVGHWNREQIKSIIRNSNLFQFENPNNITETDIDKLFDSKNDEECRSIIASLTKCYKTPIISCVNYYKLDYMLILQQP